ncbi:hypothetical protein QYE76_060045 [Lolium multiflorum]|uniref:Reverse transcriptase zinc-binding domain-containing protein n=1 Tax=Lolium multiflorum TaxID=4521 RepID=A0AAD8S0H1_LOLMU|nr:hypothetical protein QYE76_060045 [Lolium multiflorum]
MSKFLTKLHSDTSPPWASWFRRMYGWNSSRDLGDRHHLDTPIWKDIVARLSFFRSISKVSLGNGSSTAFWLDRHLQTDDVAPMVWRSAAPLKCKIFCWLARKRRLPTNERRFRHHLSTSAACLSCPLDEDTDHLLLFCPQATEVWGHFHRGFDPGILRIL